MMPPNRTVELASVIATKTEVVDDYLNSHGLPPLSFEPMEKSQQYILPDSVQAAQNAILEATDELHALMLGPMGILTQQLMSCNQLVGLHAINRFNIAEKFPKDKDEVSFSELSHETGLDEGQLRRTLAQAITQRIFTSPTKDTVAHTAASKMLTEPHVHDWVGGGCDEMWPACTKAVAAMEKWPGSQDPTQTGFNLENRTDDPVFKELAKFPRRAKQFAGDMSFRATLKGYNVSHLLDGYPWAELGACTIVDVGGSRGPTSIALAERFPNLSCIVQDLPGTVAGCTVPPELEGRLQYMAYDFFAEQPVKGKEVYFFRRVFHDWSDEYAMRILRCLIPALEPGAKVLIQDLVIPRYGTASLYQQKRHRFTDMAMLATLNARERSAEDWEDLFRSTDSRFKLSKVIQPPLASQGIIEVVWCGT